MTIEIKILIKIVHLTNFMQGSTVFWSCEDAVLSTGAMFFAIMNK